MTTNPTAPQDGGEKLALINEIISMYHTTRLRDTPAAVHILSKPSVQKAFAAVRNEALEMRVKELEEAVRQCRDQFDFYAREHRSALKFAKAETNQQFADLCSEALKQKGPSNG